MRVHRKDLLDPLPWGLFELPSMDDMVVLQRDAYLVDERWVLIQLDFFIQHFPHCPRVIVCTTSVVVVLRYVWRLVVSGVLVVGVGGCQWYGIVVRAVGWCRLGLNLDVATYVVVGLHHRYRGHRYHFHLDTEEVVAVRDTAKRVVGPVAHGNHARFGY